MGMFWATLVVFLLFVVIAQSASYYRRSRWTVAGAEGEGSSEVSGSAAIGIVSGLIVLSLLLLLFIGFTRWQWLGPPPSQATTPAIVTPAAPGSQVAPPSGVTISPAASPGSSPSPAPTPSR